MQLKTCRLLFLALFSLLFFVTAASSKTIGEDLTPDPTSPLILFVNGIANDGPAAAQSSEDLINVLRFYKITPDKFSFTYFYNQTDGFIDDDRELLLQAAISDAARAKSGANQLDYYRILGKHYLDKNLILSSLSGREKRVVAVTALLKSKIEAELAYRSYLVIVPHSQGNFYVEAAYAMLVAEKKNSLIARMRVFGVASVASTTPSGRYITHYQDKAVLGQSASTHNSGLGGVNLKNYDVLAQNEVACIGNDCGPDVSWSSIDKFAHGFSEVYLNTGVHNLKGLAFPKIIFDGVVALIADLDSSLPYKALFDEFSAASLDGTKWTGRSSLPGYGLPTVSSGIAHFENCQYADTKGKVNLTGSRFVIEARFAGPKSWGRDTWIGLFDPASGSRLLIHDTNYQGWGVNVYLDKNNVQELNQSFGGSTSAFKEYRITIEASTVTVERGDSLLTLDEKYVVPLPRSATDGKYYVGIGTGGCDGYYSPGEFDWIRVSTN